jgi:hypothetical protein
MTFFGDLWALLATLALTAPQRAVLFAIVAAVTALRSSLPSSSSLRAGNSTPSKYLPTCPGRRFLKKSTVLCLLLADRWRYGTAPR